MFVKILTAEVHNCRSNADYEIRQALAIAKLKARNYPVAIEIIKEPIKARINAGRLVADCKCHNMCFVSDPSWPGPSVARCFDCGNIYKVTLPRNLDRIQELLLARPQMGNRGWRPHQSIGDLQRENTEHRVGGNG